MKDLIPEIILAVIGANALFEFIKFLIERYDKKSQSPEKTMLRALGADRLGILLRDWKHEDVREAADWEVIENMYKGYIELGGNGEIKKLYDECADMPTTE